MLEKYSKQSTKLCIDYSITNAQHGCHEKWVYNAKYPTS